MNIIRKLKIEVDLTNIKPGQVFLCGDDVFVRTQDGANLQLIVDVGYLVVMDASTGGLLKMRADAKVTPLLNELVVKPDLGRTVPS